MIGDDLDPQTLTMLRSLARQVNDIDQRVRDQARASQGRDRSVEGGSQSLYDEDDELRAVVGELPDGGWGVVTYGGDVPPAPSVPLVAQFAGGATLTWDGFDEYDEQSWQAGSRILVHMDTVPGFAPTVETVIGVFDSLDGGALSVAQPPDVTTYVKFVARTLAGIESGPSVEASAMGGPPRADGPNGTGVRMSTVINAFESGQNWALVNFVPGLTGWNPGLAWGWDNGIQIGEAGDGEAALRLSSPYNPAAAGSDPFFKAALLDLRAKEDGTTSAVLYANTLEMRGETFQITTSDGLAADFNILGTSFVQFQPWTVDPADPLANRLAINLGVLGTVELRSRNKAGAQKRLTLDGSSIEFAAQGAGNLMVSADGGAQAWLGRASLDSGIRYTVAGETQSRNFGGALIPHVASSHPTSSDAGWKTAVAPVADALTILEALDPQRWEWCDTGSIRDGTAGVGFPAQAVAPWIPEAVSGTPLSEGGDGLGLDVMPIVGVLWAAVRELRGQVQILQGGA